MPRTISCIQCGVVLNLPPQAAGKRLKCPKCGTKFQIDQDTTKYPSTEMSTLDASPASSHEIPRGHGDLSLPTASGDLRETFDLPLMSEAAPAGDLVVPGADAAPAQAGDALALFQEKKSAPRRVNAAEARSSARRCPTCGGNVPAGMSLCSTCGLDLETGSRIDLEDDLMPDAPARPSGPPLPVSVIAIVSLLGSLILALYSLIQWTNKQEGWQYFIPICLFGAFAAVNLLRGRSAKLLIVALTLGVMVDVVGFIAMPIFQAYQDQVIVEQKPSSDDPDAADVAIRPITEGLSYNRISLGIAGLFAYAIVAVYLSSPSVRRHYVRQ